MTAPTGPSDAAIRLAAVEAAGRRLGVTPEPHSDPRSAQVMAAGDVIATAKMIESYIRTGRYDV